MARPDTVTFPLVSLDGVTRRRVVAGVTFEVQAGEIVGLVGASGCGKSTLLALIAGWLRPHTGRVTIAGRPAPSLAARRLAGLAPAAPAFPPGLTVRSLLEYYARFHGAGSERRGMVAAALDFADLGALAGSRASALPLGALRRLALAQAALGRRRVLLLDETLDGADARVRTHLLDRLEAFAWNGGVVFVASHDLTTVERLVHRIILLRDGVVVRDEPAIVTLQRRVLEIVLDAPPAAPPPGFRVAPFGVETDLGGRTVEAALAMCRAHRLVVRATRVRLRSLDDVVVESAGRFS